MLSYSNMKEPKEDRSSSHEQIQKLSSPKEKLVYNLTFFRESMKEIEPTLKQQGMSPEQIKQRAGDYQDYFFIALDEGRAHPTDAVAAHMEFFGSNREEAGVYVVETRVS